MAAFSNASLDARKRSTHYCLARTIPSWAANLRCFRGISANLFHLTAVSITAWANDATAATSAQAEQESTNMISRTSDSWPVRKPEQRDAGQPGSLPVHPLRL